MGGSEYRNTATKYNKHRIIARNIINTPTPQDLLGLNVFFFFFLNVITVTSTFQTQETHHKTILPPSPHVKFLAVAYTSF